VSKLIRNDGKPAESQAVSYSSHQLAKISLDLDSRAITTRCCSNEHWVCPMHLDSKQ